MGNVFSFVLNWVIAKQNNWEIVLRIEDIDGPRKKTESIAEMIDTLGWLGIDWTGEPRIQTQHLHSSNALLHSLIDKNLAYHCALTRTELEAASTAPHSSDEPDKQRYRPNDVLTHNQSVPTIDTNWRFVCNESNLSFYDQLVGEKMFANNVDFILWTKATMPSYQLAVVADDHDQAITHVVRGNDLLQSTAWQEQLYKAMGWEIPQWYHHPLIVGTDGKRLAKRHGDSRVSTLRTQGVTSERIIGLIAMWTNTQESLQTMTIEQFANRFDLAELPQTNVTFTKKDEVWLFE